MIPIILCFLQGKFARKIFYHGKLKGGSSKESGGLREAQAELTDHEEHRMPPTVYSLRPPPGSETSR